MYSPKKIEIVSALFAPIILVLSSYWVMSVQGQLWIFLTVLLPIYGLSLLCMVSKSLLLISVLVAIGAVLSIFIYQGTYVLEFSASILLGLALSALHAHLVSKRYE